MSKIFDDKDRQVVPIWRGFSETLLKGELDPTVPNAEVRASEDQIVDLLLDWQLRPGVSVASDLVCSAWSLGLESAATEAAEFLLAHADTPPLAREVAALCLNVPLPKLPAQEDGHILRLPLAEPSPHTPILFRRFHVEIRNARQKLSLYPRNPILWCHLSRLYTTLGQGEKALHVIRVALNLSPENRYVLRSASRFFLHQGERDLAHRILARSERLKSDPWILSAEIATAAAVGKRSQHIKYAGKLIEAGRHSPYHLSELASALGTVDAVAGNRKSSRRLIQFSLQAPSENAIAQADWLSRNLRFINVEEMDRSMSAEAKAWHGRQLGDWGLAVRAARQWQESQPFSSRPATFGSFLAGEVLEDYSLAVQIAELGKESNPDDVGIRNNLAYSLASWGKLDKAQEVLRGVSLKTADPGSRTAVAATLGLIAFRAGETSLGRWYYNLAIDTAERSDDRMRAALARVHFALEALRVEEPDAEELRGRALSGSEDLFEPWGKVVIDRLARFEPHRR